MVFATDTFLELAIKSWPEWNLNPWPLISDQMLQLTEILGHEFNTHSQPTLYSYSNFILFLASSLISSVCFRQSLRLFN